MNKEELKKRIQEPIDEKVIRYMPKGGANIPFVNITDLKDVLDERAGFGNWSVYIKNEMVAGDYYVVTVTLGITTDEEALSQDGQGSEKVTKEDYGGFVASAYAQAFRRACESFGLGRELWRKEELGYASGGKSDYRGNTSQQSAPKQTFTPAKNDQGEIEFPSDPISKSLSDLVTAKQLGMIRAISRELGIDADEECNAVMKCRADELSKRAGSALIQHLQELEKGDSSPPDDAKTMSDLQEESYRVQTEMKSIADGKKAITELGGAVPSRGVQQSNTDYIEQLRKVFVAVRDKVNQKETAEPSNATAEQVKLLRDTVEVSKFFTEEELSQLNSNGAVTKFTELTQAQASTALESLGVEV